MPKVAVFSQIIKLIPRSHFETSVAKHKGDARIRKLDCWTWFGALMFSQLSGHDSIRCIERVFEVGNREIANLGFGSVCRSTLSDAGKTRPLAVIKDMFTYALDLATKARGKKLDLGFPVYLLDSTFIELCLSLCPWAHYRRSDKKTGSVKYAGVKLHTAIDLTGHLPEFVIVKEGTEKTNGDLKVAREGFNFQRGSLVVFDRGYWSAPYFEELRKKEVGFVTRPKNARIRFRVVKSSKVNRTRGLICDQLIYLNGPGTKGVYKGVLRRISYRDPDTKKKLTFITNRLDLPAETICQLYKSRWQVELFFRAMKQNLKIKKFIGLSKNAIFAQIYAALIAYVLVIYLKLTTRSSISATELMAVVATMLLLKHNIIDLLQHRPKTMRHPPPIQLSLDLANAFR